MMKEILKRQQRGCEYWEGEIITLQPIILSHNFLAMVKFPLVLRVALIRVCIMKWYKARSCRHEVLGPEESGRKTNCIY